MYRMNNFLLTVIVAIALPVTLLPGEGSPSPTETVATDAASSDGAEISPAFPPVSATPPAAACRAAPEPGGPSIPLGSLPASLGAGGAAGAAAPLTAPVAKAGEAGSVWCVCFDIWIFCGCFGTTCDDDGFCV